MKIVINGIGVAGPALGYWLTKAGHEVLLVEDAPHLRAGGYLIDFWGIGYDIVEEMGLIGEIRRLGYQVRELRLVGRDGRKRGGFDLTVFGRMTHDRFTSVRTASEPGLSSYGLGLFICRDIVEQLGGRLCIQSRRDEGTRVSVLVPVLSEGAPREEAGR